MIGLAIYLNGKKLAVAGADDLSVLNAVVGALGTLGPKTRPSRQGKRSVTLFLSVSGLTRRKDDIEDEHLRWIQQRRIRVGDQISVRVVRTTRVEPPETTITVTEAQRNAAKFRLKSRGQRMRAKLNRPREK